MASFTAIFPASTYRTSNVLIVTGLLNACPNGKSECVYKCKWKEIEAEDGEKEDRLVKCYSVPPVLSQRGARHDSPPQNAYSRFPRCH